MQAVDVLPGCASTSPRCSCPRKQPFIAPRPSFTQKSTPLRYSKSRARRISARAVLQVDSPSSLYVPQQILQLTTMRGAAPAGATYDEHRARKPPPDLPSLMLDARIVYLGMPLVPAVTELLIAELLYLQSRDQTTPVNFYINSTGTTRADGETVGFETEGTAVYDAMCFLNCPIYTLGVGVAMGQSCMLLSAGTKGNRFMLPHATAMLQQPRLPPTGQRQAIEVHIKWREVLAQKLNLLNILSKTTGHSMEKLDADLQRPLYMTAQDAIEYGIIDRIVKPESEVYGDVKKPEQWDRDAGLVERPAPGASQGGWS